MFFDNLHYEKLLQNTTFSETNYYKVAIFKKFNCIIKLEHNYIFLFKYYNCIEEICMLHISNKAFFSIKQYGEFM